MKIKKSDFKALIYFASLVVGLEFLALIMMRISGFEPAFAMPPVSLQTSVPVALVAISSFLLILLFGCLGTCLRSRPLVAVNIHLLWSCTVILNVAWFLLRGEASRYVTGSFTPALLLTYYLTQILSLIFSLAAAEIDYVAKNRSKTLLFTLTLLVRIDGLSMALTSVATLAILYRKVVAGRIVRFSILALFIAAIGAYAKWGDGPSIEKLGWVAARFSIPAVTSLQLSGNVHYIENSEDSLGLILYAAECRLAYFTSQASGGCANEIKSIGGANYFSLYGIVKGGSSAGVTASIMLVGIGFWIVVLPSITVGRLIGRLGDSSGALMLGSALYVLLRPMFASLYDIFLIASYPFLLVMTLFIYSFFFRITTRPRRLISSIGVSRE